MAMDALLAHDREHARQLDPAEKLRQALDVMRAGIRLKRLTLRRQFAEADETEVDHHLAEWLRGDGWAGPGAGTSCNLPRFGAARPPFRIGRRPSRVRSR